jgi:hypothetical protein
MKTVVSIQEITELEIKPHSEVDEWRRLVEEEAAAKWRDRSSWITVSCPCCLEPAAHKAFARLGVGYVECTACRTVYARERPSEIELRSWYRDSAPARFWRERMMVASGDVRHRKIVLPRAQWVRDGIAEYVPQATRLLDVSANGGSLVNALVEGAPELEAAVVGWTADLEATSAGRVLVEPTPVDDWERHGPVHLVTAIDAFDRAPDLPALVCAARNSLVPGGVLFATTPVASGFEIQSLWDQSPTILPPDKLNIATVDGLLRLFAGAGWEVLELSTPGMFDVDIVRHAIAESPDSAWPRVLRVLVEGADAEESRRLTEYLQSRRLTSFARLVARRVD